jgi:antitoxin PrlF
MPTVTVSDKGQVVIPAAIRRGLGIKPGVELEFELHGDAIWVTMRHAVPPSDIDSGYGMLSAKPSRRPRKLEDFDAAQALAPRPRAKK